MKFARVMVVLSILTAVGVAAIYFLVPLGFLGNVNDSVQKLGNTPLLQWNELSTQILTYNALTFNQITINFVESSTWWGVGMALVAAVYLLASFLARSSIPYIILFLFALIIGFFGSFLLGGLLLITAAVGVINGAVDMRDKIKLADYDYLYREYI